MSRTDETTFAAAVERHRRELHVHCYRMLGSFDEAEDALQEALTRAWRRRETYAGDGLRAWLYKIATNVCLDELRRTKRRVPTLHSFAEVPWLQPYPDRLLDEIAPAEEQPDAVVVARETIALTYMAVIQLLPPRQRAVLILRDVLEWSAAETAQMLEITVAAANSALQRARATLAAASAPDVRPAALSADEQRLLEGFIHAHETGDFALATQLMRDRVTMPPQPMCFSGRADVRRLTATAAEMGDWRLVPIRANRQPAAASYLRRPGDSAWRAFKIDVLRCAGEHIAEITTFGSALFARFGLPETLGEAA